jgi:hypothetical protein
MRPKVAARMEERDNLLRYRIDTGQVRAFTEIAAVTRECEIPVIVGSAMLTRDHMLDIVGERAIVLREETIFLALVRTSVRVAESIVTWDRKAACGP